jgi:hypothetical protein
MRISFAHVRQRGLYPRLAAAIDDDRRAGARESLRDGPADAGRGPGHDSLASLEIDNHGVLLFLNG